MSHRALVVLADGAQAAFCAGVVGELARDGVTWEQGAGAGLGVVLALLGVAGEAEQGEHLFSRQPKGAEGLFSSVLQQAKAQNQNPELWLVPDVMRISGWLARGVLEEYLSPYLPLAGQVPVWAAFEELLEGRRGWRRLEEGADLSASVGFPWGWPPDDRQAWGGVEVCCGLPWPPIEAGQVDLVCGFPVPAVERPGLGRSLFLLSQRRAEIAGAAQVERWARERQEIKVWAPREDTYDAFVDRSLAVLGVEYPLPTEDNKELCQTMVDYGRWLVKGAKGREKP